MLFRRTWAVARKELRHIGRSRLNLFLVALAPALLLFLLAYVFAFDVDSADLAVMDLSQSRASRDYVNALTSSNALRWAVNADSYDAINRLLVAGRVDAALVIPPGFRQVSPGQERVPVQLIVDGGNPIIARQIIAMVTAGSAAAGAQMHPVVQPLDSLVEDGGGLAAMMRSRIWYNDALKSQISMVPGLMGIVLSMPALALTLSLTREKELGTLEGLIATPLEGVAYLAGKMSAYILTGLVGFLLSWLVAVTWFKVPFRGSVELLIMLTVLYFTATMGISLLIASLVSSQQTAMLLTMLIFFVPSFFLAGLIDPIDRQSRVAVMLSLPLPATHYITITRGLFLKGVGMETLLQPSLLLLLMGVTALLISTVTFKKKLA